MKRYERGVQRLMRAAWSMNAAVLLVAPVVGQEPERPVGSPAVVPASNRPTEQPGATAPSLPSTQPNPNAPNPTGNPPAVKPTSPAAATPAVTAPLPAAQPALRIPGTIELARLVDLCAARLGISIDYDAAALKQTVTWRTPGTATDLQVWEATNRLLAQRTFTTVRMSGSDGYTVVKLDEAAKSAMCEPQASIRELAEQVKSGVTKPRPGFRCIAIRLEHLSSRDALEIVKPALRAQGSLAGTVALSTGVIQIADLSPRLDDAIMLLAAADIPENATVIEEITLQYIAPKQAMEQLTALQGKRDTIAGEKLVGDVLTASNGTSLTLVAPRRLLPQWKTLIGQIDKREPVQTITYTPRLFAVRDVATLITQIIGSPSGVGGGGAGASTPGVDERFKMIVEEPTASLIITATNSQHERIGELITRLDSVPMEARRPVRTFVVRNRPVGELIEVLDRMIRAGVLESSLAEGDQGAASGGALTAPAATSGVGTSGINPAALPVGANPTNTFTMPNGQRSGTAPLLQSPAKTAPITRTESRISDSAISLTADESTSTIIAIGESRLLDQLAALVKQLDVRQPQVMLEVMLVSLSESDSVQLGLQLEKLNVDGSITSRLTTLFGLATAASAGVSGTVISPGDFSVIARAVQTVSAGRTGSFPSVLVSNNQRASFNGVTQQPFASSFTAGNSSTPTTTFGGTLDAGTQISVRPQIAEGDQLLLEYNVSISSFVGAGTGTLPPARQVNSVTSQATIPDGYAVIVGGLEVNTEGTNATQVPMLGSIPIIGNAFKDQSITSSKTRFLVFIRANVIRGTTMEGLRHVSKEQLKSVKVPSGWPDNEPQLIR